jgi:hypothetical protein
MNTKEKSIELVSKYYYNFSNNLEDAKQCALIAVDEILKITWVDKFLTVEEYWKQVKEQIEKIKTV